MIFDFAETLLGFRFAQELRKNYEEDEILLMRYNTVVCP